MNDIIEDNIIFQVNNDGQSLTIRVGPIFDENNNILKEFGIWIFYNDGAEHGPFLMTQDTFDKLKKHVRRRNKHRSRIMVLLHYYWTIYVRRK